MNSHLASSMACATAGYATHTWALIAVVTGILRLVNASWSRQNPTRIPYSCHAQFGTSGMTATPCGEVRYCRGMPFSMDHSSMLTMVHTAMRAPLGSFHGRRDAIGEYSKRSWGSFTAAASFNMGVRRGL